MAASKLTLSIETDVIERAKDYAKRNHTALSKLVQAYLIEITKDAALKENDKTQAI